MEIINAGIDRYQVVGLKSKEVFFQGTWHECLEYYYNETFKSE